MAALNSFSDLSSLRPNDSSIGKDQYKLASNYLAFLILASKLASNISKLFQFLCAVQFYNLV